MQPIMSLIPFGGMKNVHAGYTLFIYMTSSSRVQPARGCAIGGGNAGGSDGTSGLISVFSGAGGLILELESTPTASAAPERKVADRRGAAFGAAIFGSAGTFGALGFLS